MNRHIVAVMLGLSLAGCAQTRTALPTQGGQTLGPVGLTSFPSIHESINRENPQVDAAALRAGVVPGAGQGGNTTVVLDERTGVATARPGLPPGRGAASTAAPSAWPASRPIHLEHVDPRDNTDTGVPPPPAIRPASAAPVAPSAPTSTGLEPTDRPTALAPAVSEVPATDTQAAAAAASPAGPEPQAPAPPVEAAETSSDVVPASAPAPDATGSDPAQKGKGAGATEPKPSDPATAGDSDSLPPIELPKSSAGDEAGSPPPAAEKSPDTPAGADPAPPAEPPAGAAPAPPAEPPPGAPLAVEAPPPVDAPPPVEAPPPMGAPPAVEAPPPMAAPPAVEAPPEPPASPAEAGGPPSSPAPPPAAAPEPEAPPIPPMLPPPSEAPPAEPAGSSAKADVPKRDDAVQTTAADASMLHMDPQPRNAQSAGKVAAKVGDEVITAHKLRRAVQERLKGVPPGQSLSQDELKMVAASVLQELIERSVIVQDAKRELKDRYDTFIAHADGEWTERELPPLLQRYAATNEYELREKLKEQDISLDDMRETFREQYLAQGYMKAKLGAKLTISLPEMRKYYNEHLKDFDRPELVVWREIVIETDKCASRTQARGKAERALARLRLGEDFAKVAQAESDGPNKAKGGLWETSPGSYAIEAVNSVVASSPTGRVSQIIEAPSSYHIVRVESRRAAGPASFAEVEVQDKIKRAVYDEKVRREMTTYLAKLRQKTLIVSMFDPPEGAGGRSR